MNRVSAFLFLVFLAPFLIAEEETPQIRRSVAAVTPFLVRINTVGGLEKVGQEFANEGTGTGILLDKDGYVITAAFLFLHDPTSIIVQFSDGSKKIAQKVSTDHTRMLTLLKTEPLTMEIPPMKVISSLSEVIVGERCIAVGTALSPLEPNIALGLISGKNRIWGKALQTDASVSPNNYGGPLMDKEGKILGILVPLSMMSDELTAGAEFYDAGVGTAVPMCDVLTLLPKLKEGKELESGITGIRFNDNRIFIGEAVIDDIQKNSPAEKSGLKKGDKITVLNEKAVSSAMDVVKVLRSCYAGDTLSFRFLRDGKEQKLSLTAEVPKKAE